MIIVLKQMQFDITIIISDFVSRNEFARLYWREEFCVPQYIDKILIYPSEADYPMILADLKIFKSRGDARRNGWGPIPTGYSFHKIGKFKHMIEVLKWGMEDEKVY
jgi:hypothetical protein